MDCGRSVGQPWLQPNILLQGCRFLKISSSTAMATIYHTQWWFIHPKSASDHPGVVWIQFPSPRIPAHDRLGLALSGSLVHTQLLNLLFAANLDMCIHMHTHVHIHAFTYAFIYTCTHIYTFIGALAICNLPTCHTVGASNLLLP